MVGGFNPLKTISQLGWFFPIYIYGKKNMFQTTNQIIFIWLRHSHLRLLSETPCGTEFCAELIKDLHLDGNSRSDRG